MGLQDEIKSAVNWNTPSVDMNDSLRIAIRKMKEGGATALLVKMKNEVIGVIADMDLMRSVALKKDLDTTKVLESMTACELITSKAAKSPCVQLDESETVENALGVLHLAGLHNLVVSGGKADFAGTASVRDLLALAIA